MIITESNAKLKVGDNLYTFLQKDEDSKIKLYLDGEDINLVTKEEVLDNIEDATYKDTFKAWYCINGNLIQVAFKEEVEVPKYYELIFNKQEGFKTTENLYRDSQFTTTKVLNVETSLRYIECNEGNIDLVYNDKNIFSINKNNITLNEVDTKSSLYTINLITETQLTHNNVEINVKEDDIGVELLSIKTKAKERIIDYINETEFIYNNAEINVKENKAGAELSSEKIKVINHKHLINYDDEEKFTCDNAEINVESIGARGARVSFQEDGEV